jgi:hypothetical protein
MIRHDSTKYQYFFPKEGDGAQFEMLDGYSRADTWSPPEVYIPQPELLRGNFLNFGDGFLIADAEASEALSYLFRIAGEVLPLFYEGRNYSVLNVTECADCINHAQCALDERSRSDGTKGDRYVFRPGLIPLSPIFKIPERDRGPLFVVEGNMDDESEFRHIVKSRCLTGLIIDEVWSNESEEI